MILNNDTLELYAAKYYDNPFCQGKDEFLGDFERVWFAKKLIRKFNRNGNVNIRLLLNHIIALSNVFPLPASKEILMHVMKDQEKETMKTCLLFLGHMHKSEYPEIDANLNIISQLRSIYGTTSS